MTHLLLKLKTVQKALASNTRNWHNAFLLHVVLRRGKKEVIRGDRLRIETGEAREKKEMREEKTKRTDI